MEQIIQKILAVTATAWQIRLVPNRKARPHIRVHRAAHPVSTGGMNLLGTRWALLNGWAC